jgi:AAA15 family ATPase/GTPase
MSNEESIFRRLVIKNFRNLAPFCSGTADDRNEDKEFLTLNRSLERDELGGIVTLIGVNNSGKSNVLDALEVYGCRMFSKEDYTDFLYTDPVKPSITMNIDNGRFGNIRSTPRTGKESTGRRILTGPFRVVLFGIMMEEESYNLVQEYVRRPRRTESTMWPDSLLDLRSDCSMKEWKGIGYSHIFLDKKSEVVSYILNKRGLTLLNKTSLYDYYNDNVGRYKWDMSGPCYSEPTITVISDGIPIDCSDDKNASSMLKKLTQSTFNSGVEESRPEEGIDDKGITEDQAAFEKRYGYVISNEVMRYNRKKIGRSSLSCDPSDLNPVIISLLEHLDFNEGSVRNAYNNHTLRSRLERKINESLKELSDEFNELLNIGEKLYSFEIRLEKDNIELLIMYGDDIPLNIDKQSEGFRWLFDFYFGFLLKEELAPGCIILMDEFGNSLGFSTIGELMKNLRRFAQSKGVTFVMATQNPMAVDVLHLDEIRLVVPMEDGSAHIVNNFDQFGEVGSHDVMGPVISGLMVSRNFMRTEGRRTVFVEGATDYFYLNAFSEALRMRGREIDVDFIPMNGLGGREDAPTKVLSQIKSIERSPTVFVDGDRAGERFVSVASSKGIRPSSVSEIFEGKKREIEDLFSEKDAERFRVREKSFDRAACFSHKLGLIYDEMDEETKENFEKVIEYIMAQ